MNFDFEEESNIGDAELLKNLKQMKNAPILEGNFQKEEMDFMNLEHSVRKKKGSWYQLPKDME